MTRAAPNIRPKIPRSALGWSCALLPLVVACYQVQPRSRIDAAGIWRYTSARAPVERSEIDLAEAVALARKHSPLLALHRADARLAAADSAAATQLDNPQLRVQNLDTVRNEPRVALRVPVPQPWTLSALQARSDLAAEAGRVTADNAESLLITRIRQLFAELSYCKQLTKILENEATLLQQRRVQMDAMLEHHLTTAAEHAQFVMQEIRAEQEREATQERTSEINEELRFIVGVNTVQFKAPQLLAPAKNDTLKDLPFAERALRQNRSLKRASLDVQRAEAEVAVERSLAWPWLKFVQLNYDFQTAPDPNRQSVSVAIDLPVFSQNGEKIAAREAQLAKESAEEKTLAADTARQLRSLMTKIQRLKERIFRIENDLLPRLRRVQNVAEQTIATPETDSRALLLNARLEASAGEKSHLDALWNYNKLLIDLAQLAGCAEQTVEQCLKLNPRP